MRPSRLRAHRVNRSGAYPEWLGGIADRVAAQLDRRDPSSQRDILVWSDGSVTGPQDNGNRTDELRLVATFTPGERPSAAEIETTVRNGLATVPHGDEVDEPAPPRPAAR